MCADKSIKQVLVEQLELHCVNFVYVALGIFVFVIMYLMEDCLYTKEVGLLILGWIGVLITSKKFPPLNG